MKVLSTRRVKLFWIVRIIVYYLKIIGLAPFSVGTPTPIMSSHRERVRTFRFSKFGQFYNILLILGIIAIILIYQDWPNQNFLATFSIIRALITVRKYFRIVSAGSVIMSWAFGQRNAVRIMNGILEVEAKISGLRKQPSTKRSLIFLAVHVIINAFIWITFWTTFIKENSFEFLYNPKLVMDIFVAVQALYWFTVEYCIVVGRIARDLETVNRNLMNLKRLENSCVSLSPFVNEYLQAFSWQTQSIQLAALRSLIGVRVKLSELAQEIENFFSFPILLCIALALLALVFDIYHLIVPSGPLNTAKWPTRIAWCMVHGYPIVLLAVNVTRTNRQAKLTAQVVRKVLTKPLGPEIKAELERFSLQLIHDDFTFTACGFFTLDYTMLHSMLAVTTTYIVILLQYLSSVTEEG